MILSSLVQILKERKFLDHSLGAVQFGFFFFLKVVFCWLYIRLGIKKKSISANLILPLAFVALWFRLCYLGVFVFVTIENG